MELLSVDKRIALLRRLLAASRNRRMEWRPNKQLFNFVAESGRYRYIVYNRDDDDRQPFGVHILSLSESEAPAIHFEAQVEAAGDVAEAEVNDLLAQIYFDAKRQALGVDDATDDILRDLDEL